MTPNAPLNDDDFIQHEADVCLTAEIALDEGRYADAFQELQTVLNHGDADALIYYSLHRVCQKYSDHLRSQALALDADLSSTYHNRGMTCNILEDRLGAIREFSKALELNPHDSCSYYARGDAYYALQAYPEAIADYGIVLKYNPKDELTYFNRALARQKKGDLQGALLDFSKVLELTPKDADTYLFRGELYEELKDPHAAIADYETAKQHYFEQGDMESFQRTDAACIRLSTFQVLSLDLDEQG